MKKVVLAALIALVGGVLLRSLPAQAACGAMWHIEKGNKTVGACDGKSEDGTFSSNVELADGEYGEYILNLTLNDYDGGEFRFESYSAGVNVVKVMITLVGNNVVPQKTIMPGAYWGAPVEIRGEGTLTISDVEIESGDIGQSESTGNVEETVSDEDESKVLMIASIAAGIYIVASVVAIVFLASKVKKAKRSKR